MKSGGPRAVEDVGVEGLYRYSGCGGFATFHAGLCVQWKSGRKRNVRLSSSSGGPPLVCFECKDSTGFVYKNKERSFVHHA